MVNLTLVYYTQWYYFYICVCDTIMYHIEITFLIEGFLRTSYVHTALKSLEALSNVNTTELYTITSTLIA